MHDYGGREQELEEDDESQESIIRQKAATAAVKQDQVHVGPGRPEEDNLSNLKEEEDQEFFAGGEVVFVGHPQMDNMVNEIITIEESDKPAATPAAGLGRSDETIPRLQPDEDSKLANIEVPNMAVTTASK